MTELAIPFGLLGDRLVEPTEVPSGLACGCVCPDCLAPLVARKGESRRDYFAHHSQHPTCGGGAETAAHKMAKQILADEKRLLLPGLPLHRIGFDSRGQRYEVTANLAEQRMAQATDVRLEKKRREIGTPDALFQEPDGNTILVEFHATNPVDAKKIQRVLAQDLAMVEIDLWAFGREMPADASALRFLALDSPSNRAWLSYPGYEATELRLERSLSDRIDAANDRYRAIERNAMAMSRRVAAVDGSLPYTNGSAKTLYCKRCRNLFPPPADAIRQRLETVACPYCGDAVSTASSDPRR